MRKIKGLRWYMIALVTLGTVLGYLTRNTVAAAAPTLMDENRLCNVCCAVGRVLWCNRAGR